MLGFLRKALGIIMTIDFLVNLFVFGFLGYFIGEEVFYDKEILGLIIGIVTCIFTYSILYGFIITLLNIAEINEEMLDTLKLQNAITSQLASNSSDNPTKSTTYNGNTWICKTCGTTNPNATSICIKCKK
ncbi:MAG: hypothetical protein IJX32_01150 [Spirochaetaceae bacterium]|nr:hypothetical protein [Spirochaetaceae bacterium]